jgi:hypothetical protein
VKSFEQLRDAARAALRRVLGEPYSDVTSNWSLVATFADHVIVERPDSQLSRYPVTFDLFGTASIGEPEPVEIAYVPIKEGAASLIIGPLTEAEGGKAGSRWSVVVIQEGLSVNRTLYPAHVLQAAAALYEGAKVFWNHSDGRTLRDPRDIAGFLRGAQYGLLEAAQPVGAICATLHATDAGLRERLLEAYDAGAPDLFGLSHTAQAETERVKLGDGPATRVKTIKAVESVDVVSFPSAGGRVMRLVAGSATPVPVTPEDLVTFAQKLQKLQESSLRAHLSAEPTEAEVDALLRVLEAQGSGAPSSAGLAAPATGAPAPAQGATNPAPTPDAGRLTEADRSLLREARIQHVMTGRTFGPLQNVARRALQEMATRDATVAEMIAAADEIVQEAARLAQPPTGGSGQAAADVTRDEADKVLESVDGFFMHGASDQVRREYEALTGHAAPATGTRSIKRLYEDITGDRDVSGVLREARGLERFQRLLEAIGTGTFTNLLGDSITRRMIAEYRATDFSMRWRRICSNIVPLGDFRTQERLRWGSFADLAIVAQAGTYPTLADPTDEKVSYAPAKRGGIVSITREAIKNDDVGFVAQIPQKLALAAARTLHKFVFDLIITNPTLDDSVALFNASTNRGPTSDGNIHTTALSAANVAVARQRLLKVEDRDANTVLGLSPKILIVPVELEELAWRLTSIPMQPVSGNAATEPNIQVQRYGLNELIVLETMSDANDWFILADPRLQPTIEMGFVDGREEPELFVQDQPNVGSVFSADKVSWKLRHEYGGKVEDWRGMQGGIVT